MYKGRPTFKAAVWKRFPLSHSFQRKRPRWVQRQTTETLICVLDSKSCTWLKRRKIIRRSCAQRQAWESEPAPPCSPSPRSGGAIPGGDSTLDPQHSWTSWASIYWAGHSSEPCRALGPDRHPNKVISPCDTNCHILLSSSISSKKAKWPFLHCEHFFFRNEQFRLVKPEIVIFEFVSITMCLLHDITSLYLWIWLWVLRPKHLFHLGSP